MAFSEADIPLLATGDQEGTINFWNLNEKILFASIKQAHKGSVSSLNFMRNQLLLVSGSGQDNSIFQWVFDDNSEFKFTKLRQRVGVKSFITKLRFYGEDGTLYWGWGDIIIVEI